MGIQIVNGVLPPINLLSIWRLARNRELMGDHRNQGMLDGLTAITVGATSTLSIVLVAVTLLGL